MIWGYPYFWKHPLANFILLTHQPAVRQNCLEEDHHPCNPRRELLYKHPAGEWGLCCQGWFGWFGNLDLYIADPCSCCGLMTCSPLSTFSTFNILSASGILFKEDQSRQRFLHHKEVQQNAMLQHMIASWARALFFSKLCLSDFSNVVPCASLGEKKRYGFWHWHFAWAGYLHLSLCISGKGIWKEICHEDCRSIPLREAEKDSRFVYGETLLIKNQPCQHYQNVWMVFRQHKHLCDAGRMFGWWIVGAD